MLENRIIEFCYNELEDTGCGFCEDCNKGHIIFGSSDFDIATQFDFEIETFKDDIADALQAAEDFITYYESVVDRLKTLSKLDLN